MTISAERPNPAPQDPSSPPEDGDVVPAVPMVGKILTALALIVAIAGISLVLLAKDSVDEPAVAAPQDVPTTTAAAPVRVPVWAEEFDGLDPSIWKVEHSTFGDGNNELQCYRPEQVSVEDGNLVLLAENTDVTCPNGKDRQQTSGMVRSKGVSLSPGQSIEWRVKLTPSDQNNQGGLWPALWSSSWAGGRWPLGGEWDGFEVMTARAPERVVYSIHYADTGGSHGKSSNEVFGDRFSDDWHEFRFDYGIDGVLVWYMDGVETHRVIDAPTQQGYPAPFNEPMTEIKINLALGGSPGPLTPAALPATYQIDYVRIYDL